MYLPRPRDLRQRCRDGARIPRVRLLQLRDLPQERLVETERDADPQPVLRRTRQRLVPTGVRVGERRPVVGDLLQSPPGLGHELLELGDVGGVGAPRGPPGVVGLEAEAKLGELLWARPTQADERRQSGPESGLRRAGGKGPTGAPGADLDDAQGLERAQRLADRRPSDLEALREVALVRESLALRNPTAEDRLADLEEHVVQHAHAASGSESRTFGSGLGNGHTHSIAFGITI